MPERLWCGTPGCRRIVRAKVTLDQQFKTPPGGGPDICITTVILTCPRCGRRLDGK